MTVESPPRTCPRCDASVAADAKFCANCGQALAEASAADASTQARLVAAAPAPLVEKMRAAKLTGERKPVTALFADVVGLDGPRRADGPRGLDRDHQRGVRPHVEGRLPLRGHDRPAPGRRDARVLRRAGRARGRPRARHPAPRSTWSTATEEFARQLKATQGIDFRIRAGINTGPVIVGNVGSDLRYEYTALGDAVNVAARMQTAADPGTVLVTADDASPAGDAFELEDLGGIEVKGKAEPVHAYRVIGRKAAPARQRGLESVGLDSPMVGRDEPLRRLAGAVRRRAGRPGPRGLRRRRARDRQEPAARRAAPPRSGRGRSVDRATWVEGRCVSYGRSLPYHLLIDLVRSILGSAVRRLRGATRRAALDRRAGQAPRRRARARASDTAPYLAHLLRLPLRAGRGGARRRSTPRCSRGATSRPSTGCCGASRRGGPLVLVCEDLHWADPASLDVATPAHAPRDAAADPVRRRAAGRDGLGRLGAHRPGAGPVRRGARRDPPRAARPRPTAARSSRTCSRSSRCRRPFAT